MSEPPDQMTYLPSSSDFPLVRCAGVGLAGLEGRNTDPLGLGGELTPSCCCLARDLRLIEVTETICKRLLDYSLHKERTGSNRFAKVGLCVSFPLRLVLRAAKCVCWLCVQFEDLPWELPSYTSWKAVDTPPLLGGLTFPWP